MPRLDVTHSLLFRFQVSDVGGHRTHQERHSNGDLDAVRFKTSGFGWVVGEQSHARQTEAPENCCTAAVLPPVSRFTELDVGGDRVEALIL